MLIPETKYARSGGGHRVPGHGDGPYDLLFSGTTASKRRDRVDAA